MSLCVLLDHSLVMWAIPYYANMFVQGPHIASFHCAHAAVLFRITVTQLMYQCMHRQKNTDIGDWAWLLAGVNHAAMIWAWHVVSHVCNVVVADWSTHCTAPENTSDCAPGILEWANQLCTARTRLSAWGCHCKGRSSFACLSSAVEQQ